MSEFNVFPIDSHEEIEKAKGLLSKSVVTAMQKGLPVLKKGTGYSWGRR